jgi:hypothetical protein
MNGEAASTVADDKPAFARSRTVSHLAALARRERLVGVLALGGVLGIAALSYWATRAPLYNPSSSIDPWLYTALFTNFHEVYEHFSTTYYAARLPWIVPGRVVYDLLPLDAAYWVLHGLAFCGGVAALFFLVRRYLGLAAAVVGAGTLALTPMFWNAQRWDYIDGAMITYLLLGLCFGLPVATGPRRAASLAAAGVFFAAAVTTNLLAGLFALIYPVVYVFVQPATGLRERMVLALKDLIAFVAGAAVLVVSLGLHARANGGQFWFFEPQIDVIRGGVVGTSKIPGYEWLRLEPRLLVPVFLVLVATPLLIARGRAPSARFAAGSIAGMAFLTAAIYGWEFFAGGAVLDYTYSFSGFAIAISLGMAAIAGLVLAREQTQWTHFGAAGLAMGAGVLALGLIYYSERPEWTGRTGTRISLVLMLVAAVVIVGALVSQAPRVRAVAAALAIGAVAFASHFAINSSSEIFAYSYTAPESRNLYHAALDTVELVKNSTAPNDPLPTFWYRGDNPDFTSIQSMYYYAYTAIDWKLPRVTPEARQRLDYFKPKTIVMLCESRACSDGAAALRRAGFPYTEASARRVTRGGIRFWVVFLRAATAR